MEEPRFSTAAEVNETRAGRRGLWLLALLLTAAVLGVVALFATRSPRAERNQRAVRSVPDLPAVIDAAPPELVLPSGLRILREVTGAGASCARGTACTMHYKGYLWLDGKRGELFDESTKRGPFSAKPEHLIPGFAEAITRLGVGGSSTVVIPPVLGYGARGAGDTIPPGAWLLFELELLGVP